MSKRARVNWNEGLLLTPQHMQHLETYNEETRAELFLASRPFNFGFSSLQLDSTAIENGQIVVSSASGVTPSGVAFSFPERDSVPAGRNLEKHFPLEESSLPVYLGIRVHRSGERQVSDGDDVRYQPGLVSVTDASSGENPRDVQVCFSKMKLLFPGENLGDYDYLPVGEVVRKPEGGYQYREDFVPPCIQIAASPFIQKVLNQLLELLVARSKSLSDRRQHRGQGVAEFSKDDVAGFWLLGSVNGFIPILSHYLRWKNNHPETVYTSVASMAGVLTTMSDLEVRDTPHYDHENLGETFTALSERLPKMLKEVLPQNYTRIALTERDQHVSVGDISDERLLDPAYGWYLGVFSTMPATELQSRFPDLVKIGPPEQVDFLIANALKGVEVRHITTLPSSLPIQAGYSYFQVERHGDVWGLVAGAKSIAFYTPPELPGTKLELIALKG